MWRSLLILSLIAGLAAGSAIQRVPREKKTGFGPALATIVGTLGLLKIKAIFVTVIVFAIAAIFTKILGGGAGGCGLGTGDLGCGAAALLGPTAHSNVGVGGTYNYDQYGNTGGYSGGYYNYNHRRSAKSIQGWDILDLSLEVLGLETEECKKKFVCLADNEAIDNPLLELVMRAFGTSLSKYREGQADEPSKETRNCEKLYPKCHKTPPYPSPPKGPPTPADSPQNKLPFTDTRVKTKQQ